MRHILKNWYFISILVVIVASIFFSSIGEFLSDYYLLNAGIFLSFFLTGLGLETKKIFTSMRVVGPLVLAIISILLIFPIIGYFTGRVFFFDNRDIFVGFCILSVVPVTMVTSLLLTKLAGGDVTISLLINLSTHFLSIFTIPISLGFMLKNTVAIHLDGPQIMLKIFLLVVFPSLLGRLSALVVPAKYHHTEFASLFGKAVILLLIANAVANSAEGILSSGFEVFGVIVAAFVLHIFMLLFNYAVAGVLGFENSVRSAFTITASQKTIGLSFIVWSGFFAVFSMAMIPTICYHLIQSVFDVFVADRFAKRAFTDDNRP